MGYICNEWGLGLGVGLGIEQEIQTELFRVGLFFNSKCWCEIICTLYIVQCSGFKKEQG